MGMFLYRLQTKSGNYKWVESTYSIYNDTELNGRGHIRILTKDMTVVKDLYDYLIYSEKLSMIGQLAAGIAHEIRNPLTSIKGFLQLMQAGVIDTKNYLDIMENEIDRIETISSELLFLGRPKESQLKICSIQKLLDEVLILMESQSFKQNVRIETNFLCKPFYIRCDESKLKQVFINLVKNGLEAMEQGGTLKIEIYEAAFHQVAVAIKDEGYGIPQENLEQIGQPFYTTKEGGNGLGLMVCFQIIHEHHGKISIASEPQKGSTFTVVLPTVQPEENGQT
jgi:signal transduction histidine kinase